MRQEIMLFFFLLIVVVTDSENHRQDVPIDSNRDVVGEARLMMLEMTSSKSTVSVVVNGVTVITLHSNY